VEIADETARRRDRLGLGGGDATPGSWSWLKLWSGYIVTVLPYVSAALVLIPGLDLRIKFVVLGAFGSFVLAVRVLHEKAGVEITGPREKSKYPGDGR
jgi:hypothetical protein